VKKAPVCIRQSVNINILHTTVIHIFFRSDYSTTNSTGFTYVLIGQSQATFTTKACDVDSLSAEQRRKLSLNFSFDNPGWVLCTGTWVNADEEIFCIVTDKLWVDLAPEKWYPCCPYRKWSIKRRGAYFIFPVMGAALIQELRLFHLRVKHRGEYRENKVKICTPRAVIWTRFQEFSTLKLRTHGLVEVLFLKRYSFDLLISSARWGVNL